jgi:NAD(P)-dependent dehydrogenase (short-subunit alcohol dehydrogenase family)
MAAAAGDAATPTNEAPVAVITGGEGDLARAVRSELEAQGYAVHAPGRGALDVASTESVKAYFARLHRIDLLILNAGICNDAVLLKMETEPFSAVLECNLSGAFRCARAALRLMSKRGAGHIIAIGSYSAHRGPIGQANYAASKAGLIGLVQSLAREYGSRDIRVNCVLPGFLETRMTEKLTAEKKEQFRASHTLGRFNTAESVARMIAFFDRDLPHTSGQVFNLDSRIHRWA